MTGRSICLVPMEERDQACLFHDQILYQLMLAVLAAILLTIIWLIKEPSQ